MLFAALGKRDAISIFGTDYPTPDGTCIRDYIHVEDLAVAHVKAVNRLVNKQQEARFEVFNLGTGNGFTVMEVIKTFEKVAKMALNYRIVARRSGDVPELYASTERAKEKLNWTTQYDLEDMISSSWLWEQELRKTNNLG